jgi:hypothetical protein
MDAPKRPLAMPERIARAKASWFYSKAVLGAPFVQPPFTTAAIPANPAPAVNASFLKLLAGDTSPRIAMTASARVRHYAFSR